MPPDLCMQGRPRLRVHDNPKHDWHTAAVQVRLPGGALTVEGYRHCDDVWTWLSFVGPRGGSRGAACFTAEAGEAIERDVRHRIVFRTERPAALFPDRWGTATVVVTGHAGGYCGIELLRRSKVLHALEGHSSVFADIAAAIRFTRNHVQAPDA